MASSQTQEMDIDDEDSMLFIRKPLIFFRTNRKPPLFGGRANANACQDEEKPRAKESPGEGGLRETEGKRGVEDKEDRSPSPEYQIKAGEFGSPRTPFSAAIPPILECLDPPSVRFALKADHSSVPSKQPT